MPINLVRAIWCIGGVARLVAIVWPAYCPYSPKYVEVGRGCMKSGSRRVFRYSSTHEKEIPDGSFRRRMEMHKASPACPQRTRTAQNPHSSRDPKRRLLRPQERLPVAPAAPRLPQVAHRL